MVQELGKIDMHCDYCGAHYEFDGIDIETLFSRAPGNDANQLHLIKGGQNPPLT